MRHLRPAAIILSVLLLATLAGGPALARHPAPNDTGVAQVTCPIPGIPAPTLQSPDDGAVYPSSQGFLLDWSVVTGASKYHVQVDDASDFLSPLVNSDTTDDYWAINGNTLSAGTYYWRVKTFDSGGTCAGMYAAARTVVICSTAGPALLSPPDGAAISGAGLTLTWLPPSGTTDNLLQIAENAAFSPTETAVHVAGGSYTFTHVSNTTHYWRVKSQNACGWGDWSAARTFRPCLPATVALLSPAAGATFPAATPVTLQCSTVDLATGYEFQVQSTSPGGPSWTTSGAGAQATIPAGTLPAGDYVWRARARNTACVDGEWAKDRPLSLCAVPGQVSLSMPPNGGSINGTAVLLDWAAMATATQYQVQVAHDSGFASPETDVTVATDSYAYPYTHYSNDVHYWRVRAGSACGWGAWSAVRNFRPCGPATVYVLSPSAGATLPAAWPVTLQSAAVDLATGYEFVAQSTTPGGPSWQASMTGPQATIPGGTLPAGSYVWRARAKNTSCIDGQWSADRPFTLCTLPAVPTLDYPPDGASVPGASNLHWLAANGATQYNLEIAHDSGFAHPEFSVTQAGTTYLYSHASSDLHYWRVRAGNACGWGAWSAVRSYRPCGPGAPSLQSPAEGAQFARGETVVLRWSTVGAADAGYDFYVKGPGWGGEAGWSADGEISFDTADEPVGQYKWNVRACSSAPCESCSDWAGERTFYVCEQTPPILNSPADGASVSGTGLVLEWSAVAGRQKYQLQIAQDAGFASPEIDIAQTAETYTLADHVSYDLHYWRVRAQTDCGWAPWSAVRSFRPCRPAKVEARAPGMYARRLRTEPVVLQCSSAALAASYEFVVWPAYGSGTTWTCIAAGPEVTLPAGTLPPVQYLWHARALNPSCADGEWSNAATLYLADPPAAPVLTAPADGARVLQPGLRLDWDNVPGGVTYRVEFDTDAAFDSPVLTSYPRGSEYGFPATPARIGRFYWRVQARSDYGEGPWSAVRSFVIDPRPVPTASPNDLNLSGNITIGGGSGAGRALAGTPLANARVTARLCAADAYETLTDAAGHYTLRVPAGALDSCSTVVLEVSAPGYVAAAKPYDVTTLRSQPQNDVPVQPGRSTWLPILFKP